MAPGNRKSQGCHPAPSPLRTRGVDRRGGGKELVDPDLRLRSGPLDNYVPVPPSLTSALRIPTGRLVGWRGVGVLALGEEQPQQASLDLA